jgi:hypothetical protein
MTLYALAGGLVGLVALGGLVGFVWLCVTYPESVFLTGLVTVFSLGGTFFGLMTYESRRRKGSFE